jgi:hypothetical protein
MQTGRSRQYEADSYRQTSALTTLLQECNESAIEGKSGASREEVEAILQDLRLFLAQPSRLFIHG